MKILKIDSPIDYDILICINISLFETKALPALLLEQSPRNANL